MLANQELHGCKSKPVQFRISKQRWEMQGGTSMQKQQRSGGFSFYDKNEWEALMEALKHLNDTGKCFWLTACNLLHLNKCSTASLCSLKILRDLHLRQACSCAIRTSRQRSEQTLYELNNTANGC